MQRLSVLSNRSDEERLINEMQCHTLAMVMSSNGYIYISLNMASFSGYICNSLGVVKDCYGLRSRHINETLTNFQHGLSKDVVNESKDESSHERSDGKMMNDPQFSII